MTVWDWLINYLFIIAKILELIAGGMNKLQAVAIADDSMFNVSKSEIWRQGGF